MLLQQWYARDHTTGLWVLAPTVSSIKVMRTWPSYSQVARLNVMGKQLCEVSHADYIRLIQKLIRVTRYKTVVDRRNIV